MNPTEHFNLYHDFAEKLSASKKSVEVDESLRFSYENQVKITEDLKDSEEKIFYRVTSRGVYILAAMTFIGHIIFRGLWIGVVGLVLLAIFYALNKVLLTRASKAVLNNNSEPETGKLLTPKDLQKLQKYNSAIIDLKITRLRLLQILAVVLTPMVFLAIYDMIWNKTTVVVVGLAIIFGCFFWIIYFHSNIDLLTKKKREVKA